MFHASSEFEEFLYTIGPNEGEPVIISEEYAQLTREEFFLLAQQDFRSTIEMFQTMRQLTQHRERLRHDVVQLQALRDSVENDLIRLMRAQIRVDRDRTPSTATSEHSLSTGDAAGDAQMNLQRHPFHPVFRALASMSRDNNGSSNPQAPLSLSIDDGRSAVPTADFIVDACTEQFAPVHLSLPPDN